MDDERLMKRITRLEIQMWNLNKGPGTGDAGKDALYQHMRDNDDKEVR